MHRLFYILRHRVEVCDTNMIAVITEAKGGFVKTFPSKLSGGGQQEFWHVHMSLTTAGGPSGPSGRCIFLSPGTSAE